MPKTEIEALQDRIEHLEFCIAEMLGEPDAIQTEFGLTKCQGRLLSFLLERPGKAKSRSAALAALHWDRCVDDRSLKEVDVLIYQIRQRTASKVEISTHWGIGYSAVRAQ